MHKVLHTAMALSGNERVTTAPTSTMVCAPIFMLGNITAPPYRCNIHNNGLGKVLRVLLAARKLFVGKDDVRANKYIVNHAQIVTQLHAALNGNAIANDHVVLD